MRQATWNYQAAAVALRHMEVLCEVGDRDPGQGPVFAGRRPRLPSIFALPRWDAGSAPQAPKTDVGGSQEGTCCFLSRLALPVT